MRIAIGNDHAGIKLKPTLIEYLETDEKDESSSNDFGKNIIPNLLHNGERLYSYKFDGYWKDVGTISSLWEANMDLIGEDPVLNISDKNFRIYSKNTARAPQYVGPKSMIVNSMVSEGCRIYGSVENSILSGGVIIEEGAVVRDSVIMEDVTVKRGATVYTAIVDSDTIIMENATVGKKDAERYDIEVIARGSTVMSASSRK